MLVYCYERPLKRERGSDFLLGSDILLESAKSGNANSFGALYERYAGELYLYAYKFLGNKEDAEDAVQQASVNVYRNIKNIRNSDSFKAYYFKALANCCKNILSKRRLNIVSVEDTNEISSENSTENEIIEKSLLDKALSSLGENEREILLLSVVSGFTSKEIAKIIGLTHSTVRSKLSRTLAKLRTSLEKEKDYE